MKTHIGLDAGSVSVKYVVLNSAGQVLRKEYIRHHGDPLGVARGVLRDAPSDSFLSLTGSAGSLIAQALNIQPVNEVIALGYAVKELCPEVRTVIEMGGEDSKLILLEHGMVREFSMNSACAAGTGSFLDQQAERLRLSIEEFGEMALRAEKPPRIAGRCSVFAKSDMIHLQQIATPVEDIVAGLCFAVARNFKGSICRNMTLPEPISFMGGVAANRGVVRAFREVIPVSDLRIPEHYHVMTAIGAVLKDREEGREEAFTVEALDSFIASAAESEAGHRPLCASVDAFSERHSTDSPVERLREGKLVDAYLGIDIGSISTNLAVIDNDGRVLAKRYLMTAGRPIEAVKTGLAEIASEVGEKVNVRGVGTTGSGRYMIADFVGADIVKNEITAQARAAIEINPDVDTILEIGGQDSKYISIRDGVIVDFEMNKACAAGTGSFLEEQAEKLSISVKGEFGDLAFGSERPCSLGERCTVFMENSMLSKQQRGAPKEDLVAGLAYSIVQNYVNRVVGNRAIGERIFFQGGVAFNTSVVAAFENYLDKHITVPPHHDVTGAIGMALIARSHMRSEYRGNGSSQNRGRKRDSSFKGFDLSRRNYAIKSFECRGCDNLCEINRVQVEGEKDPLYYGSRCEKYDVKRKGKEASAAPMPDLFTERQQLLYAAHEQHSARNSGGRAAKNGKPRQRIGIPMIFFFHDFLPFWSTLLWELGFEVELSGNTSRQIVNKGVEHILAESCFPHKVAHGHIKELIDRNVDAVFLPSFINFSDNSDQLRSFACPYAQTMPYIARMVFEKMKVIRPVINMEKGQRSLVRELHRALQPYRISQSSIRSALEQAERSQKRFESAVKRRGRDVLANLSDQALIIVGRAYNAFDSGINLEIPKKLASLGIQSIPMDFLPLEAIDISSRWANMYWRSGQSILKAAEIIRDNPLLFGLYIGNFSCGPDSFIQQFFEQAMSDKPYLQIEIDEHSADAGVITRCEAFLDSIGGRENIPVRKPGLRITPVLKKGSQDKTVYIPRMSDHTFGIAAAFRKCGLDAEVMDLPNSRTVKLGRRFVTGKECYPCAITTGDMVNKVMSDGFDPERAVFFMPSGAGPCRFGQYNILHRLVLDKLGLNRIPIYAPNQDESLYSELGVVGKDFTRQAWRGISIIGLLLKCLHETRPFEVRKGEAVQLYRHHLSRIDETLRTHNGTMGRYLAGVRHSFSEIKTEEDERPLIGIIGEIFVRHNRYANEDLIEKIEELGGRVWLAPFEEWVFYINLMALRKAFTRLRSNGITADTARDILKNVLTRREQSRIEHAFAKPFEGFLRTLHEPATRDVLKNAAPYLHDSFEGEAVLSMGKAVDFIRRGASGIISAMPFGCMPGTIVTALLKGIKQDFGVPCLSIAYDGIEATGSTIQIEAFMHQAHEHMATIRRK